MHIFVKNPQGETTILKVESNDTICSIKRKLKEEEGIVVLTYNGTLLEDRHTLAHYRISNDSTLRLFLSQDSLAVAEPCILYVKTWNEERFTLNVKREDTIDDVKAKIQEREGIPSHKQLLFYRGKLLEDGKSTLADYRIHSYYTLKLAIQLESEARQMKRARPETLISDTICEMEAEFKKNKQELTIARNREKELEAIISGLKAESKKKEEIARNKEKELEANISRLKAENRKIEEELTIVRNNEKGLESSISNKQIKEELTLAPNKEKELEATISGLRHKNKLFSDQCASYESLVDDLEVENKKTKEELMNADKKYYAGARAAGYAEGLKEGKAKRMKSVEFLHRLTDASMRYFNHGFDSCLKQAEEQGFCGQLNKDSALKDVPEIKRCPIKDS